MNWLFELHRTNHTAHAIAIISLVCVAGMTLGSIAIRGIKLGTSGVLFAAILFGHFTQPVDHQTLEFVKEFGLILFVFCIGLQLGPGFFASLRHAGIRLNALATAIVVSGALTVVAAGWLFGINKAAALGIFSGSTTNTPSLGAAQQTLTSFPGVSEEQAAMPALAYAVTYPVGIIGIIGSLLILKKWLRIDVAQEVAEYAAAERAGAPPLERRTLVVENPNLAGVAIQDVPGLGESGVVVSRIRRADESDISAATVQTLLQTGDLLLAVGSARGLDQLQRVVGRSSEESLLEVTASTAQRRVVVTHKDVLGKSVRELNFDLLYGVVVTRVTRGELEMTAVPHLCLQFGDMVSVVGPQAGLEQAAARLGNSLRALNETQFVPLFAGIGVGILLGTLPFKCPGLPQPLRLGLAGGPLLVALFVGRLGRIGNLVWHMPRNANLAFREFGISLFFASVGLMAGPTFFATAISLSGAVWILTGIFVTMLPLLVIGLFARKVLGMNYVVISGLLAGSMTDPPALAFANNLCQSEAPALSYATVFPLTMLLRIMAAQILAVALCG